MHRTFAILGIVGAVLAALTALLLVAPAPAVVALFGIGAGIYLVISSDWRRVAPGAAAIVFGVLGIMGIIGTVGGETSSTEFPISEAMGYVFVIGSAIAVAGASVILTWKQFEPAWISYVWAGAWALSFVLAIVFRTGLADQTQAGTFVVAVAALANLGAPTMWIVRGPHQHASRQATATR